MDIFRTLGPLLLGGLVSTFLSGVVSMQTALYTSVYHTDITWLRTMVYVIWLLDILHTIFICIADWEYLIASWADGTVQDWIPWSIGGSVMLTALMTFIVQCFFAWRVHTVSHRKWWITIILTSVASGRLIAALVSTAYMIRLQSYEAFRREVGWVFTLGLSLSALLDILVASSLCYYLRKSRSAFSSMDAIINTLTFYTIQNGSLTFVTTFISLILWVTVDNLIFLGLHFAITKLYANAFLSTLNARKTLRLQQSSVDNDPSVPVMLGADRRSQRLHTGRMHTGLTDNIPLSSKQVEINIQRNVQISRDFDILDEPETEREDGSSSKESPTSHF
ncbi:uncharacterized protein B0H18DRAFT_1118935 [Fomitopsis serialis]|uniref:uncharacterized protein n=1 Tax=Fomitopsis serialis TaxID=139415 RepID=UPI0020088A08|nr:uncharacterized protein B0H18DRAFT_1118935 [Neoantrodia serialis]KAH9926436.1 hypothetical protein B0H18DRAFT_1118935 [Neoantrodia serialis]